METSPLEEKIYITAVRKWEMLDSIKVKMSGSGKKKRSEQEHMHTTYPDKMCN